MADDSKIAGLWARILCAGAVHPVTMAALLVEGSSVLAQENRGTEQQRVACTPDCFPGKFPTLSASLRACGGKNLN